MKLPIWFNDPSILLHQDYILEIWPQKSMEDYNQKINAITRLVILLTILGLFTTKSSNFLIIGAITLVAIVMIYRQKEPAIDKEGLELMLKEKKSPGAAPINPSQPEEIVNPSNLNLMLKKNYQEGTPDNPFGNVLLPEIKYNAQRKPAPPSFTPEVAEDITENTKRNIQHLNPGIKNTDKQLFGSMTDEFYLDQSNRVFNSTANTRIPNDQGAFAEYLYGDMPSCKDGDGLQCVKDNYRYTLY